MNLIILFKEITSVVVAVLLFVIISETWKLVSGQVIPATEFNLLGALLSKVFSSLKSE